VNNGLLFDNYQFEGRGAYPVSAETRIAFDDYWRSMHCEQHRAKPAPWVPPFALNDKQLQKVLLMRAWRYIHNGSPMPHNVKREEVNREATAKALRGYGIRDDAPPIQHVIQDKHKTAVRKAGGLLAMHAAIAFRAWRLGMDSVAVAETLGMTPQAVRQALWRMRDTARRLGLDVGHAGYTAGKKRVPRPLNTGQKKNRAAHQSKARPKPIALTN
jgi:hypothetical protein